MNVWRRLGALVLVNLFVRFLWLWYMHPPQVDDFAWYFSHATQIYNGQGYIWYGHPTAYWPIGYPFFLSLLFHLTGPSVTAGLIVNILLSTGIVLLVYALTLSVFGTPFGATLAALAYTCLPSQIEWNSVLGSEELFTFLLLLSLWVYLSGRHYWRIALSGLLMGLAADVRPIVLLFPVVILIYEAWAARARDRQTRGGVKLRQGTNWMQPLTVAVVFAVSLAAGVAPVTIRNWVAMHHFIVVSTNGGVNLWQGTHSNGAYFWSWNPKVNPLLPYAKNDYLQNKVAMHAALQFYIHHPLGAFLDGCAKLFFLYWVDWNVVSVTFAEKLPHGSSLAIRVAMWFDTVVYWGWMVLCVTGMVQAIRRYRSHNRDGESPANTTAGHRGWWLLIGYLVYNTAIFFFFPAWDRFRYPMMPLYAVFFGPFAWYIVKRRNRRKVT